MKNNRDDPMPKTGGCDCGAVTYAVAVGRLHVYACHCLNCQTRSSSAFAEHAMLTADALDCSGETVGFVRQRDGIRFTEVFCAACHTRLFNRNDMLPDMVFLRAGTLDHSAGLVPMAHIWTSRKQPWLVLPEGVPAFEQSPTPEEFGAAVQAAEARGA
ncbi:MAG: GFA family protein [Paracoccus sp. (in: a-proteobacteria)]|uniref:GFA family protein n=1 Tax=Paracoccus sp. TaxID=267 RepID=UPI0026DF7E76|nr:GFA family protein [Paracoccus sp. (in: a-proteobacteria)]MDO5612664.1 GFA family protein [Paracoccus sp. (in: a-proteobacteria)]